MNGSLPTPILQEVLNNDPRIYIAWRYLGSSTLMCVIKLYDGAGTLVQTDTCDPGSIFCDILPNQPLSNPPYSIRAAATDGTNSGPDSVPVPVITYKPAIKELSYDTVNVVVKLKPPSTPPPSGTYYVMTIYQDGDGQNSPPFEGLEGHGTLDHAPATANCYANVTANQDTHEGQYTCTSTGPSSPQVGIITQPATVEKVQYFSSGGIQIDAAGPTSVGPPINGHRSAWGNEICNFTGPTDFADTNEVVTEDFVGDSGFLSPKAGVDPDEPTCVMAAGISTDTSLGTTSVGPYCNPLQIITQAPAAVSLLSTTSAALVANWQAVPPLNPSGTVILYSVDLYRDSSLIDQQSTSLLHFTFADEFEQGRVYTASVFATADQGKIIGPASEQAPGPFISNAPTVSYDSLGRLISLSITGYRNVSYTPDNYGNIVVSEVSDDS